MNSEAIPSTGRKPLAVQAKKEANWGCMRSRWQ